MRPLARRAAHAALACVTPLAAARTTRQDGADLEKCDRPIGTVAKGEDLIALGQEKDGYLKMQGGSHEGWVRETLVRKP